ncbi:uncharacterized mitochondrial protein AtMg00310-like [Spinacia oleracea]|uniref:Uncharacterized mitochondrial protein AtMg00310-like n=1 Tax=Spinacia oleracea TaxID=3562 RepID=A0ABM3RHJ5_SPIOL|nr:uncharacterized mitochondrial protein AtMg00310-like [Spinacia oleracea]
MAGRCTLIKSVLNTYPLYSMQTTILPSMVLRNIEKNCRQFLWNKVDRSRYISRTSWDNVTRPMGVGGLGIRRLKDWNVAFMAKLCWKILTNPNKLWVLLFKENFLRRTNLFDCTVHSYNSPIWRDILQGRALLQKGLIIGIDNGRSTSLWYHHWVGSGPIYKLIDKDIP